MTVDLFTFGETMCLLTSEADRSFAVDHGFRFRFGGSESNMAIAAARLGISVRWHSRVGDGPLDRLMVETIGAQGVEVSSVQTDPRRNLGLMLKMRRADGQADVYYYRRGSAASAISRRNLPYDLIAQSRWLHLSGITPALSLQAREAWLDAISTARAHGVPISLDPNIRLKLWTAAKARRFLLGVIGEGVDLLVPNEEEAAILFGQRRVEEQAAMALAAGAKRVALKLGSRGALLAEQDGTLVHVPPWTGLPVVDPVGAGDSFAGGLIAGLLRGLPFTEAGRLGAICGAHAVSTVGDWEGAPDWEQASTFLNRGWQA